MAKNNYYKRIPIKIFPIDKIILIVYNDNRKQNTYNGSAKNDQT